MPWQSSKSLLGICEDGLEIDFGATSPFAAVIVELRVEQRGLHHFFYGRTEAIHINIVDNSSATLSYSPCPTKVENATHQ